MGTMVLSRADTRLGLREGHLTGCEQTVCSVGR